MNRFEYSAPSVGRKIVFCLPIAAFVILLVIFLIGIQDINDATAAKQKESLETALSRSIAQCYAVEGTYPENLEYLKEHYGLTYDDDLFLVDYVSYGGNLRPEVTVLQKNAK